MAENPIPPTPSRFSFKSIFEFFIRPRAVFASLAEASGGKWQLPMLLLSVTALLRIIVAGYFQAQAAAMGQVQLPPDWQWWTPEMQQNYMQAAQVTQGPTFVYIIPAVGALTSLWLGWAIISGLLHLVSTLLGGRGSMSTALNVIGWASLPFALRDILRVVFMLIVQRTIASPGLSGFVTGIEGGSAFISQILTLTDIFLLWHMVLVVVGIKITDGLTRGKAIAGALGVLLAALATQAGLGMLSSSVGGMVISRPFF
jgi:hypothetical protein